MKKMTFIILVFGIFGFNNSNAQYVGIGTENPQAVLDVNGGIKIYSDLNSIFNPKSGMIVFDGTYFSGFNGTEWQKLNEAEEIQEIRSEVKSITMNLPYQSFASPDNSITHYNHTSTGRWVLVGSTMNAPLLLPSHSVIKEVKFYYYDNEANNSARIEVQRLKMGDLQTPETITLIYGNPGVGATIQNTTMALNHTIDPDYSYYLTFSNWNSANIRIRSVSIKYTSPIFD